MIELGHSSWVLQSGPAVPLTVGLLVCSCCRCICNLELQTGRLASHTLQEQVSRQLLSLALPLPLVPAAGHASGCSPAHQLPLSLAHSIFQCSVGLHKLVPNTPEGKPVYVSYMAMQRLGDSIWTCCHRMTQRTVYNAATGREETKTVPYQPSRDSVVFAGLGMLKVRGILPSTLVVNNATQLARTRTSAHSHAGF